MGKSAASPRLSQQGAADEEVETVPVHPTKCLARRQYRKTLTKNSQVAPDIDSSNDWGGLTCALAGQSRTFRAATNQPPFVCTNLKV
jgi:hypothetical protein